jgi:monolysocardiolipin acyltransferase
LGAQEICFANTFLSIFFTCGKTIPIIRGNGVYQDAMDFALQKLNGGEWVLSDTVLLFDCLLPLNDLK